MKLLADVEFVPFYIRSRRASGTSSSEDGVQNTDNLDEREAEAVHAKMLSHARGTCKHVWFVLVRDTGECPLALQQQAGGRGYGLERAHVVGLLSNRVVLLGPIRNLHIFVLQDSGCRDADFHPVAAGRLATSNAARNDRR